MLNFYLQINIEMVAALNALVNFVASTIGYVTKFSVQNTPNFLESFQNYQRTRESSELLMLFALIAAIFLIITSISIILRNSNPSRTAKKISELHNRSATYLKNHAIKKLEYLGANKEQINIFFKMMGRNDNYISVIENPSLFEQQLTDYLRVEGNNKMAQTAQSLRNIFNFNFHNLNIAFNHTRMLLPRQKLRALFRMRGNKFDFLSMVITNQDAYYAILPPKIKNRWARMDQIKELELRVMRENDSEYQFFSPILFQSRDEVPQVLMEHTDDIVKINTRLYPRYNLSIPCKISRFVGIGLKSSEILTVYTKDISIGGACLIVPNSLIILVGDTLELNFMKNKMGSMVAKVLAHNNLKNSDKSHLNVEFAGNSEVERLVMARYIKALLMNKSNQA